MIGHLSIPRGSLGSYTTAVVGEAALLELNNQNPTIQPGWWLGHPSEKYEFVSWDDEIPNIHGKIENGNQTTNYPTVITMVPLKPEHTFKVPYGSTISATAI